MRIACLAITYFMITNTGSKRIKRKNSPLTKSTISPSIINLESIDNKNRFSVTSLTLEHGSDCKWYIPSFHQKYSSGWNRTVEAGFLSRPFACHLRLFGVGLEKTLKGYKGGGTGYVFITYGKKGSFKNFGLHTNDTQKVHCYYMTSHYYGSDFQVCSLFCCAKSFCNFTF